MDTTNNIEYDTAPTKKCHNCGAPLLGFDALVYHGHVYCSDGCIEDEQREEEDREMREYCRHPY